MFQNVEVESSMVDGKTVEYLPIASVTQEGPYEFFIPQDELCFFNLNQTRLVGSFQILHKDDTKIKNITDDTANITADAEDAKISICNMLPATLFRQVEVYLNSTQVQDITSPCYPWKHHLETLLSYSKECKDTFLRCEMYEEDETKRKEFIKNSKICNFSIKPSIDVFNSQKFLGPNVSLKLRFLRSDKTFGIIKNTSTSDYYIKIISLKLQMRKIMPTTFTKDQFYKRLAIKEAQMAFNSAKIRTYQIAKGQTNHTLSNVCNGTLPKHVMIAMVDAGAFSGVEFTDPLKYQNFKLNKVNILINGQNHLPSPLEADFETEENLIELYRHLTDNTGILHGNHSNGITYDQFKTNSSIIAFDLNPDRCLHYHNHMTTKGSISLELGFKSATANNIVVLVYMTFQSGLKFNNLQQVIKSDA